MFTECYSTAIAALILAAVTLYTERKTYEQNTATHRPRSGNAGFSRSRNRTRYSAVNPCCHHPCSQHPDAVPRCRRTVTHRFILEDSWPLQQMADTCRDTVVLLEKTLTRVMRLKKHPVPENADEKKKHTRTPAGCGAVPGTGPPVGQATGPASCGKVTNRHNRCTQRK